MQSPVKFVFSKFSCARLATVLLMTASVQNLMAESDATVIKPSAKKIVKKQKITSINKKEEKIATTQLQPDLNPLLPKNPEDETESNVTPEVKPAVVAEMKPVKVDTFVLDSEKVDDQWDAAGQLTSLPNTVKTLAEALAAAYENNQELQAKRREVLQKNERVSRARADMLPTITANGTFTGYNQRYSNDVLQTTNTNTESVRSHYMEAGVTFKQNLFAGGSTLMAIMAANQEVRGNWADLMSKEQDIFSKVIESYLKLLASMSKVDAQKAYRAAMQKSYDASFEKHKIGEETITQVANAESQLMDADARLRTAEADVVGARANFVALTNADPMGIKNPPAPTGLPTVLDKAIMIAMDNHPGIIQAQYDHASAKARIKQAEAELYSPSVDLKASSTRHADNTRTQYTYYSNQTVQEPDIKGWSRNTNNSIGVSATWELYSGGKYSSEKRAAHDAALSKRFVIENVKMQIVAALKSTYESFKAAETNIGNYKKQVKAAEIAVESTRQELEVGTKVLKDVLDMEAKLLEAKLGQIDAENKYLTAAYKMVELLGGLHARALKLNVPLFDPQKHYEEMPIGF